MSIEFMDLADSGEIYKKKHIWFILFIGVTIYLKKTDH